VLDPAAAGKHLTAEVRPVLTRLADAIAADPPQDPATAERQLRSTAEQAQLKAAALIHATRVAVTGRSVSAGIFEVLTVMGASRVGRRLRRAVTYTAGG